MYAYTVVSLHCTKWLPLSFTFITIQCNETDFTGTRHWHLEIQTNVLVVHWGCGRFTYESFRQRPVRYLLKSFLLRVGSVSQLLLPDKWKKERGIYMGQYRFFCIMTEKKNKHIHAQCSFRLLAEWHKFANGTLAKWLIGETNGHPSMTSLLWT